MNITLRCLSIFSLFAVATITSVFSDATAMPAVSVDNCVGLVGRPIAQVPVQDPQIKQAIDVLKSKKIQQNNVPQKPTKPETTITRNRTNKDINSVLILGGPEIIPM